MLRLGIYQYGGVRAKSENVEEARRVAEQAAQHHKTSVPLVLCFPEHYYELTFNHVWHTRGQLFLTGYNVADVLHVDAEPVDGPSIQTMAAIAKANGVYVVFGYPEKVTDRSTVTYYNSVILIDPEGRTLSNYRKTHLWGDYEKKYFTPGDRLASPIKINDVSVGLLICWDVEFPEPSRILMLRGADLILVPTACIDPFAAEVTVRSRAFENKIFVAYVNHAGEEGGSRFCGLSSVAAPTGQVLCTAGMENGDLLFADIEPRRAEYEESRKRDPIHIERRTELYKELI